MQAVGFRLGVDFGTSNTVAVLRWPDGRVRPLLFYGSPLLPSAVAVEPNGRFAAGRDALDSARTDPSRYEPNPKRRIDDGSVLLGDREVSSIAMIAAVLHVVAEEARRTAGGTPTEVTLTYPATWASPRRQVLVAAAVLAGLGKVRLVEEPVAAATYFAQVLGQRMATGAVLVVYDFGGGTFDVSLVERMANGFRTLAVDGFDQIGGLDLDEALIRRIRKLYLRQLAAAWQRLAQPTTAQERRQRRQFRDDVRIAKERLSHHNTAALHVPGLDQDVHVTREEFEALALPLVDQTVRLTESVVRRVDVPDERIAGVFLVGGSSRIPLVGTRVHHRLGIAPTVIEQPELVVAEGSILVERIMATVPAPRSSSLSVPPARARPPAQDPPAQDPPAQDPPPETPAPGRPRKRWLVAGIAVAAAAAVAVAVSLAALDQWRRTGGPPEVKCAATGVPIALSSPAATAYAPPPSGVPRPSPSSAPPASWHWYEDPTGFRLIVPDGWTDRRSGSIVCFSNPNGGFLSVSQWQPPDTNMVAYWTARERAVSSTLTDYQRVGIAKKDLYQAAAEWEFTFAIEGERYHASAVALVSAGRAYAIIWCTRELDWSSRLADLSRVTGAGFQPAR